MATLTTHDGATIQFVEAGSGPAVLLIHGFASHLERNWRDTGWIDALVGAGFRAVAYDQRGHGGSTKLYDPAAYALERLVEDALAVLDAVGVERATVMGYSMGARVALESVIRRPERCAALVLSGLGMSFRDLGGQPRGREAVAAALLADDPGDAAPEGLLYRRFAEASGNDRKALAACWQRPSRRVTPDELAAIRCPTLVVVGDRDGVAGDAAPLAAAIPGAELVTLAGKDHMRAVGAREHRAAVLAFLAKREK